MCSREHLHGVFMPLAARFSQSAIVGEVGGRGAGGHWSSVAPDSGGQATSLPPLNTFEQLSCAQRAPVLCYSPTTHCCLLTKHVSPGASRQRQDRIPFKHYTEEFQCQGWGWGGCIKAELQIPYELDLCQQIKMLFDLLILYIRSSNRAISSISRE